MSRWKEAKNMKKMEGGEGYEEDGRDEGYETDGRGRRI